MNNAKSNPSGYSMQATPDPNWPVYSITTTDHPTKFVAGPDGKHFAIDCDPGQVSDGYHTFDLFALLLIVEDEPRFYPFKTRKNDKGEEWDGWFIAGMDTPLGQITYHLPNEYWDKLPIREVEKNDKYDGHTAADVLERLDKLIADWG